jgi:hypothetical protein
MDYYAEQAKRKLEQRKHECDVLAKAWADIERYKTKDGKDFKNLAQNFTKGAIRNNRYNASEKEISVCRVDDNGHYFDDTMSITKTVYSDSEEAKEYEKQGRLISRGQYLHPCIELTPDEIEADISERIEYYKHIANELEDMLSNFDEIANKIVALREEAHGLMEGIAYYELRSILREERL